jgi:hypothetical protein
MADDRTEIDDHLQEVERLLRRIETQQVARATQRSRTNPSGTKRYGIDEARRDAGRALSRLMSARQKLVGTAAFLHVGGHSHA